LKAGVSAMLLPNIDSTTVESVKKACAQFPVLLPMWGLHPCHVFADWKEELQKIEPYFDLVPASAIGEIGMDLHWSKEFETEQRAALQAQLEWAVQRNLPVSLHTREATRETLDILPPFAARGVRGVFHCFSGSELEAWEAISFGFFLGIGGSITYKKNPLRDFIANIPLEKLVLETDAPYLPPVPYRGKRNEPSYLVEVTYALADLFQRSPSQIAEITTRNAVSLFHLEL
jgi:TatD DNase family protein